MYRFRVKLFSLTSCASLMANMEYGWNVKYFVGKKESGFLKSKYNRIILFLKFSKIIIVHMFFFRGNVGFGGPGSSDLQCLIYLEMMLEKPPASPRIPLMELQRQMIQTPPYLPPPMPTLLTPLLPSLPTNIKNHNEKKLHYHYYR